MTLPEGPADPPPRKRAPWSFKSLVEDVSGRPISEFQDPPVAPARSGAAPRLATDVPIPALAIDAVPEPPEAGAEEEELDPVARIYPPLSGATGRRLHGAEAEHHEATLRSVEGPEERSGSALRHRQPGPSRRPERIYLHYLLLHLDRLHDGGLRYLKHAVDEELAHRESGSTPAAAPPEGPAPAVAIPAPPAV